MSDEFIYDLEDKLKAMREIRLTAGKTQQELADLLGVHQSRITRWEAGEWRKSSHIKTMIHLVRLLDHLQLQNAKAHAAEEEQ